MGDNFEIMGKYCNTSRLRCRAVRRTQFTFIARGLKGMLRGAKQGRQTGGGVGGVATPPPWTRQLGPRYEGQLTWMAEPICHSFHSLVRPHDYHPSGLRTDEQGRTERVLERGRCLRTILRAVCGDWGGVRRGPRTTTSFSPQRELPPARLVIHRQTSAQNNVGDAGKFRRGRAY